MTIRIRTFLIVLGLLVILGLLLPSSTRATGVYGDEAARWNADLAASKVPTALVPFALRVSESPCPSQPYAKPVRGCWDAANFTIYLDPAAGGNTDRAFRHEYGHVYADFTALYLDHYAGYLRLVPQADPASEWFAETYSDCMIDTEHVRVGEHAYDYDATDAQHASVCAWIIARSRPAQTPPPRATQPPPSARPHHARSCRRKRYRRHHPRRCHVKRFDTRGRHVVRFLP